MFIFWSAVLTLDPQRTQSNILSTDWLTDWLNKWMKDGWMEYGTKVPNQYPLYQSQRANTFFSHSPSVFCNSFSCSTVDQRWWQILCHFVRGTSPSTIHFNLGQICDFVDWEHMAEVTWWQFSEPERKTLAALTSCFLEHSLWETHAAMQYVLLVRLPC